MRGADGSGEGGRPPLSFCLFFFAKSMAFRGVFLFNMVSFTKMGSVSPLRLTHRQKVLLLGRTPITIQGTIHPLQKAGPAPAPR